MINKIFGTGGIGIGIFFKFHSDRPLTRDESRLAYLTDYKDYCKAHIILHYVAALANGADVYAIGMVGNDENGSLLLNMMSAAGIDTRFVKTTDEAGTAYSVCFQYPDGAGGNITASNSACGLVTPEYIESCARGGPGVDSDSLVLAAPEVPLASRIRLLEIGRERGAFTAASFLSGEARDFLDAGGFELSDLVSVNGDEARAAAGLGEEYSGASLAEAYAGAIAARSPKTRLIVTVGAGGSYVCENGGITHIPCIPETIASTAGAGDAYLGGVIAGLAGGMSLIGSAKYGAVLARFAVRSENTIAEDVTLANLEKYFRDNG